MQFWYFISSFFVFLFSINQPALKFLLNRQAPVMNTDGYHFDEDYFTKPFTNIIEYQNYSPSYPGQPNLYILLFLERYEQKSNWELPLEDLQLAQSGLYDSILTFNFNLFWESAQGVMELKNVPMEINLTNFRGHVILKSPIITWPIKYKNEATFFWHEMTFSLEKQIIFCNHTIKSNLGPYNQIVHWLSFDQLAGLKYAHIMINNIAITHHLPKIFQRIHKITLIFDYQFGINDETEWDQILQKSIRESVLYREDHFNTYFAWPVFSLQQKRLLKTIIRENEQEIQIQLKLQNNKALEILNYYSPNFKVTLEIQQTFDLTKIFDPQEKIIFGDGEEPSELLFKKYPTYLNLLNEYCLITKENDFLVIEGKNNQEKVIGKIHIPLERKILNLTTLKKPKLKNWTLANDEKNWLGINEALFDSLQIENSELSGQNINDYIFNWNNEIPEKGTWQVIIKHQINNPFFEGQLIHQVKIEANEISEPENQSHNAKMGISLWWLMLPISLLAISLFAFYILKKRKNRSQQTS